MTLHRRLLIPAALAATAALMLAGCAGGAPEETDDDRITVVASTNVYAQIAEEIGGPLVDVTAIITSAAQDPHSFEPSARDQLTVSRADLIIENGGGYDSFMDGLIDASGTDAPVITAVEFSHDWPGADGHGHGDDDHGHEDDHADDDHADDEHGHDDEHAHAEDDHDHGHDDHGHDDAHAEDDHGHDEEHAEDAHDHDGHGHIEGFNEHVWYDPHTMEHLAEAIADELSELDPENASVFETNLARFTEGIAVLEDALAAIEADHGGAHVFVTEPVPAYLIETAGLENVTPPAFSEAVEEGQDVPPATLLAALRLIESGDAQVVIANAQTGGAETTQVISEAESRGIPVLEFTETLPAGQTYLSWMQANIEALADALAE